MQLKTIDQMTFDERTAVMRGMEAAKADKPATACPHDATNVSLMNAWLQGHVTQNDEPETAREIYESL